MKLQRHYVSQKAVLAAALTASLFAMSGLASAFVEGDTLKYIFSPGAAQTAALGGSGDYNNTLLAGGYTSEGYNYLNGANLTDDVIDSSGGEIGVQNGGALGTNGGNNRRAAGIDMGTFNMLGGPGTDGSVETIVSVTLLLYVTSASITAPDPVISIYAGLNNVDFTSPALASFSVSQAQVGTYISVNVPASVAFSGFTLGDFNRRNPQDGENFGSEDNTTFAFQPAYAVNTVYVIPEPSAALMGAFGSLVLLRRRRA
jgi:hypothetical protein